MLFLLFSWFCFLYEDDVSFHVFVSNDFGMLSFSNLFLGHQNFLPSTKQDQSTAPSSEDLTHHALLVFSKALF
jgi:hypothetical protein